MKLLYPVPPNSMVTQTYAEHVQYAKAHGYCYKPGNNCFSYYYGGIDWGITNGTEIRAAQNGTVSIVRHDNTGYGTHVRIEHAENYMTIYGHLKSVIVSVNEKVVAGQVIAYSDNTGFSTGPHLHFEVRLKGVPIDPYPLLVTHIDPVPTPEPEPEPTPGPEFPALPKAIVVVSKLFIRVEPSIKSSKAGYLERDTVVEVMREIKDSKYTWLQIGYKQFIAMNYMDSIYVRWA